MYTKVKYPCGHEETLFVLSIWSLLVSIIYWTDAKREMDCPLHGKKCKR